LIKKEKLMRIACAVALVVMGLAPLTVPTMALAKARVVAATPAQGAAVKAPRAVTLTFSEAQLPQTVAASIVMTAMPGMANHGEMVIRNFTTGWSNGNRTMTLTLRQPLRTGSYDVRWQAAGADGHRMTGKISFSVS
jgi:copper resistance protein C